MGLNKTEIHVKTEKSPESFMELARTVDKFLFDEVIIHKISIGQEGRVIEYSYVRTGRPAIKMHPFVVTPSQFRAAVVEAQKPGSDFAKTTVAANLFADGARQYAEKNAVAAPDDMADLAFIDSLHPEQPEPPA